MLCWAKPWRTPHPDSKSVDWNTIRSLFEHAAADVLILIDRCAAISSASARRHTSSQVLETIAACGFESRAPAPGRFSFTSTLIEVLDEWKDRTYSAAHLHSELLFRMKHERPAKGRHTRIFEWRSTPIHITSTGNPHAVSIELRRQLSPEPPGPTENVYIRPVTDADATIWTRDIGSGGSDICSASYELIGLSGAHQIPHILISVALEPHQSHDIEESRKWLQEFPMLAKMG